MLGNLIHETDSGYLLDEAQNHAIRVRRVSVVVLRTWAETLMGPQVFDVVHTIGRVLSTAADILSVD